MKDAQERADRTLGEALRRPQSVSGVSTNPDIYYSGYQSEGFFLWRDRHYQSSSKKLFEWDTKTLLVILV